jgi:hypothetical protein
MKSQFEPWAIQTYLHKRSYNIMYVITKIMPIAFYFTNGYDSFTDYLLVGFIFFYFEIYLLVKYLKIKTQVKQLYGDNTTVEVRFLDHSIQFVSDNSELSMPWTDISRVQETKWFFTLYKNGIVTTMLYKRIMSDEDITSIRSYLKTKQEESIINVR